MNRILVTGGAGFVGSSICCELAERHPGSHIVALDNLKRRGSELNLDRLTQRGVQFVHGDVRIPGDWPFWKDGVAAVIDCAAEPSVLAGVTDAPDYVVETNLLGAWRALDYARRSDAAILLVSSSRTYSIPALTTIPLVESTTRFDVAVNVAGPGVSYGGINEMFPVSGFRSLYGATKLAAEMLVEEYVATYRTRAIVNRCGVIAGPHQMGRVDQGVFALWFARHYFQQPLAYVGYNGQGKQVRDYLHVADLVDLVDWQLQHVDALAGGIFNVGGGRANSLSLAELTALARAATGKQTVVDPDPVMRANDIPWYITDHSEITARSSWRPTRTLEQLADDVCRWIRNDEETLSRVFAVGANAVCR